MHTYTYTDWQTHHCISSFLVHCTRQSIDIIEWWSQHELIFIICHHCTSCWCPWLPDINKLSRNNLIFRLLAHNSIKMTSDRVVYCIWWWAKTCYYCLKFNRIGYIWMNGRLLLKHNVTIKRISQLNSQNVVVIVHTVVIRNRDVNQRYHVCVLICIFIDVFFWHVLESAENCISQFRLTCNQRQRKIQQSILIHTHTLTVSLSLTSSNYIAEVKKEWKKWSKWKDNLITLYRTIKNVSFPKTKCCGLQLKFVSLICGIYWVFDLFAK